LGVKVHPVIHGRACFTKRGRAGEREMREKSKTRKTTISLRKTNL
jgi:hypothetical protein